MFLRRFLAGDVVSGLIGFAIIDSVNLCIQSFNVFVRIVQRVVEREKTIWYSHFTQLFISSSSTESKNLSKRFAIGNQL